MNYKNRTHYNEIVRVLSENLSLEDVYLYKIHIFVHNFVLFTNNERKQIMNIKSFYNE